MSELVTSMGREEMIEHFVKSGVMSGLSEAIWNDAADDWDVLSLAADELLFAQGDPNTSFFMIASGLVEVFLTRGDKEERLALLPPGQTVGEFQVLMGGVRSAAVRAIEPTLLIRWQKDSFDRVAEAFPALVERLSELTHRRLRRNQLRSILPRLLGPLTPAILQDIEALTEWVQLSRGERLIQQGKPNDALFVVCSGRLQERQRDELGQWTPGDEVSRGATVGELSFFMGELPPADIVALRDSECIRLSRASFDKLIDLHPQLMMIITKKLIRGVRHTIKGSQPDLHICNIALVALHDRVDLSAIRRRLERALSGFGSVRCFDSEEVDRELGQEGLANVSEAHPSSLRLQAWLEEEEHKFRFSLYQADRTPNAWSERCVRRADQVLLVGWASGDPGQTLLERELVGLGRPGHNLCKRLVLLYEDGSALPKHTDRWLQPRSRLLGHHHVRLDREDDFLRLARFLGGHTVGLVLGGGGARGLAHIGAVLALQEAGVCVDMVGGTSMGAILGAQVAMEATHQEIVQRCREALIEARPFRAYTLPVLSLIARHRIEASLEMIYDQICVEDLWRSFFAVSSNLSRHQLQVHHTGRLTHVLRASSALPGVLPPAIQDGQLLLDGALLNNLPGDIMRKHCRYVIALDVSVDAELLVPVKVPPTPWRWLWERLGLVRQRYFPNLIEVMANATMIASEQHARKVRQDADFFLRLPVGPFSLLDFSAMERLIEVGYEATQKALSQPDLPDWLKCP